MGPRASLWMVLNRENWTTFDCQAGNGSVIEMDVGDLHVFGQGAGLDGIAVIL